MDILKLRYLIREAIEDTIQQQSVFKMGQKVTTKDGDTATITMVEHPYYSVEIESTGTTQSFQFKELAPFVEKVVEPKNEGFLIKENAIVSPGIEFHHNNNLNLLECVYRIGSEAYVNFYAEAKSLFKEGKIQVNGSDKEVLDTDLGEFSLYEITSTVSKRRAGAELKQKLNTVLAKVDYFDQNYLSEGDYADRLANSGTDSDGRNTWGDKTGYSDEEMRQGKGKLKTYPDKDGLNVWGDKV